MLSYIPESLDIESAIKCLPVELTSLAPLDVTTASVDFLCHYLHSEVNKCRIIFSSVEIFHRLCIF